MDLDGFCWTLFNKVSKKTVKNTNNLQRTDDFFNPRQYVDQILYMDNTATTIVTLP